MRTANNPLLLYGIVFYLLQALSEPHHFDLYTARVPVFTVSHRYTNKKQRGALYLVVRARGGSLILLNAQEVTVGTLLRPCRRLHVGVEFM